MQHSYEQHDFRCFAKAARSCARVSARAREWLCWPAWRDRVDACLYLSLRVAHDCGLAAPTPRDPRDVLIPHFQFAGAYQAEARWRLKTLARREVALLLCFASAKCLAQSTVAVDGVRMRRSLSLPSHARRVVRLVMAWYELPDWLLQLECHAETDAEARHRLSNTDIQTLLGHQNQNQN